MIKIEALTLELAYVEAAQKLDCSVTQLHIEVVQVPTKGFLGMFKKSAIIVAVFKQEESIAQEPKQTSQVQTPKTNETTKKDKAVKKAKEVKRKSKEKPTHTMLNETIMPASFVSDQDDDDDDLGSGLEYTADYDDEFDESENDGTVVSQDMQNIAAEVEVEINSLFKLTCFSIEKIEVSV